MPRHKKPFATWQQRVGVCAWEGSRYIMRFWHPSHNTPFNVEVSQLNKLDYDIPIVSAVAASSVSAEVWFDIPRKGATMELLTGRDLKIARGEIKDE